LLIHQDEIYFGTPNINSDDRFHFELHHIVDELSILHLSKATEAVFWRELLRYGLQLAESHCLDGKLSPKTAAKTLS
jgi:hypothetical protein